MQRPKGINILITGTPGTGKTSLAELLVQELGDFKQVEVGTIVKENCFYSEYDKELDTHIVEEDDEDRLLDFMEPMMVGGDNHVVDYHSSELFPQRWFHLVVVLRTSTEVLFERLTARKYSDQKRDENMEVEIQGLCEEEARKAYDDSIVVVRENNTLDDLAATVDLIRQRVDALRRTTA
ncbi:putative kinase [Trypanosoma rangeli]|uniref:Adenylate kinase isoenzyme 6 homolog n=1 Tax=Trypanosoma rangeli TaxID=5698 RepID=A0A3R7N3J3_TRYRA|nr:putative kinase [Trypanosoma rangeli]RNF12263.1 putative kinase [Trypanosoma rangeli]|eukprot:RNF12263.1 putative kinase [Trypanosoma rangeli]